MKGIDLSPWVVTEAHDVFVAKPWIRVEKQQILLPSGAVVDDYYHIELSDYCIVFAETVDGRVIVECQYKHGVGEVTLTLPAGSKIWAATSLTAITNRCARAYIFRARQAQLVAEPHSGDLEEMEIVLMTVEDLIDAIHSNDISLMGSMAAIALATNPLIQQS